MSATNVTFSTGRSGGMNREMQRALEADGEKLRQITGEDHGPVFLDDAPEQWFVCDECGGSGEIITGTWGCEPGCGHPHMIEDGHPCEKCHGDGGWIGDAEAEERLG